MVDKYVVIGNPIEQSKSPFIHQQFAKQTNQTLDYQKQLVAADGFDQFISSFRAIGGKGCNITMPFKEQAYAVATQLSDRAKAAGAVNTLTFNDDGSISGDNTDGQGLVGDLLRNNVVLKNARILVLGAGGAARGCILPLLQQQPANIVVANRTASKALTLANQFNESGNVISCGFDELSDQYDVIINSTSTSLSGELPKIPAAIIASANCCYDMVYKNEATIFLAWANELGVPNTIDGLGMLVGQAAESFRVWHNVTPQMDSVLEQMRKGL